MSAVSRGLRNPFRTRVRTAVVVLLLAIIIGLFAVMVQGALATQQRLESLQANVRTVIELREAGAFGTGGFGADAPAGSAEMGREQGTEYFSLRTLERIGGIPHADHIAKIEEYVMEPQIDPSVPNAYAMLIGLRLGTPLRAIGEVDYENARIVAGRNLGAQDRDQDVAVVGRHYARERLGIVAPATDAVLSGKTINIGGRPLQVVGIYSTDNDFGDNHVFIPIETFRRVLHPGDKLSKIWVTADSIANVEAIRNELQQIPGVDAVTAAEQVASARATLGSIAAATLYGSLLLFALGGVLVVFIMVLTTRERIKEIGTLKAIGAPNYEVVKQFLAEIVALTGLAAVGAVVIAVLFAKILQTTLSVDVQIDGETFLLIVLGGLTFAAIGSCYPILKGIRLSPIQAMRNT
ncbi:MAG: ABC transporter permease [Afipia felis]|jgi:putative ABC transport system permease protein|uniref:ABC transporter permease n=1 Tax=Rhizobium sp. WW_1 TaxID=1907375 RepID=UPI0006466157|nr:ABC transporter permease [Rhizobium sp. WW_1]MBN9604649.1 ABC transporter permease [Afipia felis]RKD74826.1 ABC-type antimicrobial peptide transport system permease subunit [Rhizobium sp. WW_1]